VRQYLLKAVNLSGDSVGIVGDPAHASTGGYHEGNDDLARVGRLTADYSKRESARDRPGTNSASALDIGDFSHHGLTLRALTLNLVVACQYGDPRTRDIREIIYTPDGSSVRRWDRLGIRPTGDSSHLYHTHLSFFRDSEGRRAAPDNVLGPLVEIIEGGPTMASVWDEQIGAGYPPGGAPYGNNHLLAHLFRTAIGYTWYRVDEIKAAVLAGFAADEARDKARTAAINALARAVQAGGGAVDTAAILAHIDEVAAAESQSVIALRAEIADLQQRLAAVQQAVSQQAVVPVQAGPAEPAVPAVRA
jgi:hypothetical protein